MEAWRLVDCIDPADGPEDFPAIPIQSEPQLRAELDRLRKRQPSIIALSSESQGGLQIGIGGPWAGLSWGDRRRFRDSRRILAGRRHCDQPIEFQSEGDTLYYRP